MQDRAPRGLEPPALAVREPLAGEREKGEVRKDVSRPVEALLEARRDSAVRLFGPLRPPSDPRARLTEERHAFLLALGRAIRLDQGERLARRERVRLDRAHDAFLLPAPNTRERARDQGLELSRVDPLLDLWREVVREREPALHPPRLPPENARDRALTHARPLEERHHDARLVHGRDRAPWCIRREQERVGLLERAGALEHHGDFVVPERTPPLEALEAVHELHVAVLRGHSPER